jgi:hypothetical protein
MRRLIESDSYQRRCGNRFQLRGDQNQKQRFENDRTGYRVVVPPSLSRRGRPKKFHFAAPGRRIMCVDGLILYWISDERRDFNSRPLAR